MKIIAKNKLEATKNGQNLLKPMQITAKTLRKAARKARILSPGRPSDKNITRHAPTPLRLARTHGTHDTHETKTKTKRSRSPGYGGKEKHKSPTGARGRNPNLPGEGRGRNPNLPGEGRGGNTNLPRELAGETEISQGRAAGETQISHEGVVAGSSR